MENPIAPNNVSIETVITNAIKIPGVKVKRNEFLAKAFANTPDVIDDVIESGTIEAGISREELLQKAKKLIMTRTSESSIASFLAGIPGGFAMAATIPADVLQFFGMTLRLAQELSYLYGADDLWQNGEVDDEKVRNQLILYCGVMFGVSGAAAGVRVLSTQIAKTTLKKLPQKALTKTFWYPIVKKIGAAIGVKVTKSTVAQGLSKVIPVFGGVISGGLNFASMLPMANRLQATLDEAAFDYTEEEMEADFVDIESAINEVVSSEEEKIKSKVDSVAKAAGEKLSDAKKKAGAILKKASDKKKSAAAYEDLKKLQELKDLGIITEEEFEEKKQKLLSDI